LDMGLEVRHPVSLKAAEAQDAFAALDADIAVVVAYGLILPQVILDAPTQGCLNIHASLLPRWRGAAPIHRAIMAGDAETGICIMQMDAGLDTGDVLLQRATPIGEVETTGQLHDRLSMMGADMIVETLATLPNLTRSPQPAEGVIYAEKIAKAEAQIDWSQSADRVDAHIRGLSPFPGAWSLVDGKRVKFLASRLATGAGQAGTVLDGLTIACGSGAQDADVFLRGMPLPAGTVIGG
jgi:methionyl-tRNA formyltransferase